MTDTAPLRAPARPAVGTAGREEGSAVEAPRVRLAAGALTFSDSTPSAASASAVVVLVGSDWESVRGRAGSAPEAETSGVTTSALSYTGALSVAIAVSSSARAAPAAAEVAASAASTTGATADRAGRSRSTLARVCSSSGTPLSPELAAVALDERCAWAALGPEAGREAAEAAAVAARRARAAAAATAADDDDDSGAAEDDEDCVTTRALRPALALAAAFAAAAAAAVATATALLFRAAAGASWPAEARGGALLDGTGDGLYTRGGTRRELPDAVPVEVAVEVTVAVAVDVAVDDAVSQVGADSDRTGASTATTASPAGAADVGAVAAGVVTVPVAVPAAGAAAAAAGPEGGKRPSGASARDKGKS